MSASKREIHVVVVSQGIRVVAAPKIESANLYSLAL